MGSWEELLFFSKKSYGITSFFNLEHVDYMWIKKYKLFVALYGSKSAYFK